MILFWSIFAIIFVNNLIMRFSNEIGLKSLTVVGLFDLGTRVMNELLMA